MAYLNEADREQLLDELTKMDFNKAKRKLRRMDKKARLRLYRNFQATGEWVTRYDLVSLGTSVILIEARTSGYEGSPQDRNQAEFQLTRVIVEPLPDNRT